MQSSTDNILDPIPAQDFCELRAAEEGKPAGIRFFAFNTVVDIEAFGEAELCITAFEKARELCRTYERLFSRTLPHSDIARINAASGKPVTIDPRTREVLQAGLHYCAESEGAFDITIGSVLRLWDFHKGTVPEREKLAEAVRHVNWHNLKLGANLHLADELPFKSRHHTQTSWLEESRESSGGATVECWAQLEDPQAAVDIGGIAKGWIADRLTETLEAHGLEGIIINLGGNVVVSGAKPDGSAWRVGIRNPREPEKLIGAVPLSAGSVVTSGTYERCFTAADGTFYHHILSPRTGMPVQTDVAGVSVIAKKSLDAEGFSTTLLALGLEQGCALARRHPEISQAFFIDKEGHITAAKTKEEPESGR